MLLYTRSLHLKMDILICSVYDYARKADIKSATHLAILYADRRDRRKSPGVPGAAITIFADRRDQRIKLISGMSDIGD